jgi:hypothetical protein
VCELGLLEDGLLEEGASEVAEKKVCGSSGESILAQMASIVAAMKNEGTCLFFLPDGCQLFEGPANDAPVDASCDLPSGGVEGFFFFFSWCQLQIYLRIYFFLGGERVVFTQLICLCL